MSLQLLTLRTRKHKCQRKRRRSTAVQRVIWTQAMEAQLVELWKAHPSLFDVASQNYHDHNNRENSWIYTAAQSQLPDQCFSLAI